MSDGELAGEVELNLTIEEARMIYGALKHLEIFETIGVGIEVRTISLAKCKDLLKLKLDEMKLQGEEKVLILSRKEIRIMMEVELHLDRYAIADSEPRRPVKKWKGKKR